MAIHSFLQLQDFTKSQKWRPFLLLRSILKKCFAIYKNRILESLNFAESLESFVDFMESPYDFTVFISGFSKWITSHSANVRKDGKR